MDDINAAGPSAVRSGVHQMTAGLVRASGDAHKSVYSAEGSLVTQRKGYGKLMSRVGAMDKIQKKSRKGLTTSHEDAEALSTGDIGG